MVRRLDVPVALAKLSRAYTRWTDDYRRFARMRGFPTFNDWPYHRRGFLECWAEPGFHRFWQVWNPGIAYFVHRLYLRLGGRKSWTLPTISSFGLCGLAHTLVVAPFQSHWSNSLIVAFLLFGVLAVLSRRLASTSRSTSVSSSGRSTSDSEPTTGSRACGLD
jgi:hypothetical protein